MKIKIRYILDIIAMAFPNIRATATYRKHGGGLVVYAREQAHDGQE